MTRRIMEFEVSRDQVQSAYIFPYIKKGLQYRLLVYFGECSIGGILIIQTSKCQQKPSNYPDILIIQT